MNCLICNRDTGPDGDNHAVYEDTHGNYGSTVLDMEPLVRLSICDWCLVERRDRLRLVVTKSCLTCGADRRGVKELLPLPDNEITTDSLPKEPDYSNKCGACGGAFGNCPHTDGSGLG